MSKTMKELGAKYTKSLAEKLIGVQPLKPPRGLATRLNILYGKKVTGSINGRHAGRNPDGTKVTPVLKRKPR